MSGRGAFIRGACAAGAVALTGSRARAATIVEVAYAGSMGSLMEGPIKRAAAAQLGVELHGRGQGATALAHLIAGGSIRPDVFISVTPGPMETIIRARKARSAVAIARTAMVIAYSPRSRWAAALSAAARGERGARPWWRILEEPGLRFGRTDPLTDPQGRNVIFLLELAARYYAQPDLAKRILGPSVNPQQIFPETAVMERLQSGALDASSAYAVQPPPFGLPSIALPAPIDLGDDRFAAAYRRVGLTLGTHVYRPQALIFYAAALESARQPQAARAFVRWLRQAPAQAIFRQHHYGAPGASVALGP